MRTISQLVVIISFMFALLGQAYANATLSCQSPKGHQHLSSLSNTQESSSAVSHEHTGHSMSMNNHDTKHMVVEKPQTVNEHGACCMTDCQCPTTGCGSAAFLFASVLQTVENSIAETYLVIAPSFSSLVALTLYRPPIIA